MHKIVLKSLKLEFAGRMWADYKIVWFLKFSSTIQKLFNVEKFTFLHFSYGVMTSVSTFKF